MTATEMEDLLKNLDRRTSRIEQILPTPATKEDLKAVQATATASLILRHDRCLRHRRRDVRVT